MTWRSNIDLMTSRSNLDLIVQGAGHILMATTFLNSLRLWLRFSYVRPWPCLALRPQSCGLGLGLEDPGLKSPGLDLGLEGYRHWPWP